MIEAPLRFAARAVLVLALFGVANFASAATFHVDTFGAQPNNPSFNSAPAFLSAINAALAAGGENEVVMGEGRYYLGAPADAQPFLLINNADNLTIRGQGPDVTWVINTRPRGGAFQFMQGDNIVVRDFSYDHEPLPFTQGLIVASNEAANTIDVQIDAGFPLPDGAWFSNDALVNYPGGRWAMVFDATNRRMEPDAPDFIFMRGAVTNLGGGVYRFAADGTAEQGKIDTMDVGDLFVGLIRPIIGGPLFFYQTNFARVENVHIYSSPSLAITSINAVRTTIINSRVEPLPSSNRLISTSGDGWHFQQDRVGPHIEGTYLKGMADDGVAINTFPNRIASVVDSRTLIVDSTVLIQPGDDIILFNPRDGVVLLEARVVTLAGIAPPAGITTSFAYELVLDKDIPTLTLLPNNPQSDALFNLSAGSNDYIVRNNVIDHHRGRSIFVQSARGLIEGNVITNTSSYGIVVANEPSWPVGPIPSEMLIRNNTVINAAENTFWFAGGALTAAIQVRGSRGTNNAVATTRLIRDVVVSGNIVIDPPTTGIYVAATTDALLFDNQILSTGNRAAPKSDEAIIIDQVGGAVLVDNTIIDTPSNPLFRDGLRLSATVDNECDGLALLDFSTTLAPGRQPIRDQRAIPGNYICGASAFAFPVFLESTLMEYGKVPAGEDITIQVRFPENTNVPIMNASAFELSNLSIGQIVVVPEGFDVILRGLATGDAHLSLRQGTLFNQFGWSNAASRKFPFRITETPVSEVAEWWVLH